MNGTLWRIKFVSQGSPTLIDRTGKSTVATTDARTHYIYLSDELEGDFLVRVLIHELGHCAMISFRLLDDIHRMVYPEYWIEAEEWLCNYLADYGLKIFSIMYSILGYEAWRCVPYEIERLIS